jgi:hypothetical protein
MKKPAMPKAPRKPTKPTTPQKVLKLHRSIYIDKVNSDKGASLKDFINEIPEGYSAEDVFLYMSRDYDECYSYSCCGCCSSSSSLDVYYMEEVENTHYKTQMKAYEKKMATYNKKLAEFKIKFEEWKAKKDDYIEALKAYDAENTERTIAKLEKELRKLKAS